MSMRTSPGEWSSCSVFRRRSTLVGTLFSALLVLVATASSAAPISVQGTNGYVWGLRAVVDGVSMPIGTPTGIPDRTIIDPLAVGASYGSSLPIDLASSSLVVDLDAGPAGELISFDFRVQDFSLLLDPSMVALQAVDVYNATISSAFPGTVSLDPGANTGGCTVVSRICAPSTVTADVQGFYPDGTVFPAPGATMPMSSLTEDQAELLFIEGHNSVQLAIFGVTLASFPQMAHPDFEFDPLDPTGGLPTVEIQANIFFVGAIPEPMGVATFATGLLLAGLHLRPRGRDRSA